MGSTIGLIFSLLITFGVGLSFFTSPKKLEDVIVLIIFIGLDIFFGIKYKNRNSDTAKEKKEQKLAKKEEQKKNKDFLDRSVNVIHQAGLPIAQDTNCLVTYEDDIFKMSGGGNDFELKKEKITDIAIKTDTEIQNQYVSSIGGAVAGGMVFGPLGAIVGGRVKKKTLSKIAYYLIFTYRSNDDISYISFELPEYCLKKASVWTKEFEKNSGTRPEAIEL